MYRILYLLLFILLCTSHLYSQALQARDFKHYSTEDGLSDNVVTGIAEDATGFLWLTTRSGLNRFNGNRFLQFHSTADPGSLSSEELTGIYRLDDHRLAVVGSGVHIIDTRSGKQKNLVIPYKDNRYAFKFNMTMQAIGDKRTGNMFVLSRSGFYHFSENDSLLYRFDYYADSLVAINHLIFGGKMLELDEHRLLITSVNGLYVYEKRTKTLRKISRDEIPQLNDFLAYPVIPFEYFQIEPGSFFIYHPVQRRLYHVDIKKRETVSTAWPEQIGEPAWRSKLLPAEHGQFILTLQQSGFVRVYFDTDRKSPFRISGTNELPEFVCNDILADQDHRLLIATNKGLLRQQLQPEAVQTGFITGIQTFANAALDDAVSLNNNVYVATRGAGLAVFAKDDLHFKKMIRIPGTHPGLNSITSLLVMPGGKLLAGTMANPLIFDAASERFSVLNPPGWTPRDWVHNINKASQGDTWISAHQIYRYRASVNKFDTLPGYPQLLDAPVAIQEDREGNVWMARHGLARYNSLLKQYDRYVDSFPFIKIADKQVSAFTFDRNNNIWLGVQNNGLLAYSPVNGTFRHFTQANGLANDQISAVYYLDNKIWVASHAGISSIDTGNFAVNNYGPEDGFPDAPVNPGSRFFYDSTDQRLYISFSDMVARFDPAAISQTVNPPRVFIESVAINGDTVIYLPGPTVFTNWKRRQLRISIGNINFFDGPMQRFSYRFRGADSTSWTDLGQETSFSVSGLSAGSHRLEVRVSSAGNRWPPQFIFLDIIVEAPFWLKPWFLVLEAAVAIGLIYLLIRWRTSLARRKEMINTQILELRAEDYKAQIELEQITHYFSSSLAGKDTEDEIVKDVAARLIGSLNYEECIIYLWNNDQTKMIQKAAFGPKNDNDLIKTSDFTVKPGQGIVGRVIETKKPVLVNDTRQDPNYRVDDLFRLSEIAVPILHNGELLGVIDSEHSQANYFDERDVKLLTTIATLLGNKLKQLNSEQSLAAKQLELAGLNEQLAEARLSALQAQMNPHFVFNALNSIKRMILESENDKASRYLSKFALMIRMTLEHSKEPFVTLHDNAQYLKAYLDMETLRFDHTFTWAIDVDESVDDEQICLPPMMIQPLVENAIWHGLMYAGADKRLQINFTIIENRLRCTVQDNGIGILRSEELRNKSRPLHRPVGLENLRKRISIMNGKYQTACTLTITDIREKEGTGSGTRAVLEMNILTV